MNVTNRANAMSTLYPALMADMERFGVRFDKDGIAPPATPPAAPPEPPVTPPATPPAGPSEAEKTMAAEIAKLKADAEALAGATPTEIAELRKLKAEAEKLAATAAAAKKKAEEDDLRKNGDFAALQARMAEEHSRELTELQTKASSLQAIVDQLGLEANNMALNSAFANSRFITASTIFGPSKAKMIYGPHFEVEAGNIVGYDKPKGEERRTKLVDARGTPLPFDEAISRLVEADPDRDQVLRAKQKPGTGQGDSGTPAKPPAKDEPTGLARIRLGLASLKPSSSLPR